MPKKKKKIIHEEHLLHKAEQKCTHAIQEIPLASIYGYRYAPDPKSQLRKTVAIHQTQPILVNWNSEKERYEIVDGRGRSFGREVEGCDTVRAIVYHDLTDEEKIVVSSTTQHLRRENHINTYHEIDTLRKKGYTEEDICKKFGYAKSEYAKVCSLDKLDPRFLDAFENNDHGFGFHKAYQISRLSQEQQEELYDVYNEEGKITNKDIQTVRQSQVEQDIDALLGDVLQKQRKEQGDRIAELIQRLDILVPDTHPLRLSITKLVEKLEQT